MNKYNTEILKEKIQKINTIDRPVSIMEVCGTHTYAIGKFGIRNVLSEKINLISGPGCPVCVTPNIYLDYIYDLALEKDMIITTYGDMIRVPGSKPELTLEKAKARGAAVRIVYSSIDALKIASGNPEKKVVFLGIGFETTAPATAIALKEAMSQGIKNFYILSLHKLVEPVMRALLSDREVKVDGFLCPGHVAVVTGEQGFKFLEEYKCPSAIAGFELDEVIEGIYSIVKSIQSNDYTVKNAYRALVRKNGNGTAQKLISEVFEVEDDYWRGMGMIGESGLKLKKEFMEFDIDTLYPLDFSQGEKKSSACKCGEVLKGKMKPAECKLFKTVCTPENPIGPCMVSGEGSCSAYYKFSL